MRPCLHQRLRVQLRQKCLALGVQSLSLHMIRPSIAQRILDSLHVQAQLTLHLADPNDRSDNLWFISELRSQMGIRVPVARLKLGTQRIEVRTHTLEQHSLILLHSRAHARPGKQLVKQRKDPQPFTRRMRVGEQVAESFNESRLDVRNTLSVQRLGMG